MSRAPIAMICDGLVLRPADAYSQQQIDELPRGATYNVRVSKLSAHGKEEREGLRGLWWAGCEVLANNVDHKLWDTKRKASDEILKGLGFVRPRFRIDKSVDMIPVSLAEDAMDDEEMAVLLERARTFCIDRWDFDPFQTWIDEQEAAKGNRRTT